MSFTELRDIFEREMAVSALSDGGLGLTVQLVEQFSDLFSEHLPRGSALRFGKDLLPQWWWQNQDPTQIDGRVLVKGTGRFGAEIQIPDGPSFTIDHRRLLEGILSGRVLEAQ